MGGGLSFRGESPPPDCGSPSCLICSGKTSMGDFLSQAMSAIERGAWGSIGVVGEVPMTYTYGRAHKGLPELVITGMPPEITSEVVQAAAHIGCPGGYDDVLEGFTVQVIPAPTTRLALARRLFDGELQALQILWPDKGGRWPWDPRYSSAPQPILIFKESCSATMESPRTKPGSSGFWF